jgi:Secretion system C-terminal sorting domain
MKKTLKIFVYLLLFFTKVSVAQNGNYVFSNTEAINFGTIDLATPNLAGQTWATNRSSTPGYFGVFNSATFTGASDAKNINGYVKKYGNTAFTFPVGTGTDLRTLSFSAPATTTESYATAWIIGNPSGNLDPTLPNAGTHNINAVTLPIFSVSPVGQWDWQVGNDLGGTGTGAGLTITVSIPDMTTFAVANKLRLVGWNGTSWIDLSGMPTASGNTENSTLTGTMVSGITAIGIGNLLNPLPVKLESFTAYSKNCSTILNWKTSQEINSLHFEIEQSDDGVIFTKTKTITAAGNSSLPIQYETIVLQKETNKLYRLKLMDIGGSFSYSNIVAVTNSCIKNETISIYPNPLVDNNILNINFNTAYSGKAEIICLNTIGQIVSSQSMNITAGYNATTINFSKLPKGTYFINIIKANGERINGEQKVMKL